MHWVYPSVIDIFDNKLKKNRIVQSEFCVVGAHLGAMELILSNEIITYFSLD